MPKRIHPKLTFDEVNTLIAYNPESGVLTWKNRHSIRIKHAGAVAGTLDLNGYVLISIKYRRVRGHQIAWLLMTGEWPKDEIDHIDGVKSNNRWENLRHANRSINMQNLQGPRRDNCGGVLGAHYLKHADRWCAEIRINNKRHYLGCFKTAEEAGAAYQEAKIRLAA